MFTHADFCKFSNLDSLPSNYSMLYKGFIMHEKDLDEMFERNTKIEEKIFSCAFSYHTLLLLCTYVYDRCITPNKHRWFSTLFSLGTGIYHTYKELIHLDIYTCNFTYLYMYILHLNAFVRARLRCICGWPSKSRAWAAKSHTRCEDTFNPCREGAKAQASNRSFIPLGSSASAKSNSRPTTLLST